MSASMSAAAAAAAAAAPSAEAHAAASKAFKLRASTAHVTVWGTSGRGLVPL